MKIALTGHSKGIGAAVAEVLNDSCQVKGFSRSNGYSINTQEGRRKIIEESMDCDIFISNAFSDENPWAQTDLLIELWEEWQGLEKRIIVFSSSSTHRWEPLKHGTRGLQYRTAKQSLECAAEQLWNQSNWPLVTIVAPTLMDVERTKHLNFGKRMNPDDFTQAIKNIVFETGHQTRKLIFNFLPVEDGSKEN